MYALWPLPGDPAEKEASNGAALDGVPPEGTADA